MIEDLRIESRLPASNGVHLSVESLFARSVRAFGILVPLCSSVPHTLLLTLTAFSQGINLETVWQFLLTSFTLKSLSRDIIYFPRRVRRYGGMVVASK